MNNIDNGTGKIESRIKLVRSSSIGNYSWDTSDSNINNGYGINDWTQADLMQELNGDYLDTTLTENTTWYNNQNNAKTETFDITKRLNSLSQTRIDNAKWYLGGTNYSQYSLDSEGNAAKFYEYERGTTVWGSKSGQTCNDGYCPRTTEWTGKVALIYPSDYGFAIGENVRNTCLTYSLAKYVNETCKYSNWIYLSAYQWLLSPRTNSSSSAFGAIKLADYNTYRAATVRPTVYLKSEITITGGDGSQTNPYTLG